MSNVKEQVASAGITNAMRKHIEHEVEHLAHVLPGQGPIETFIHHNTLHGFQHLHFEKALAEASHLLGTRSYLPLEDYRAFYKQGRITKGDLEQALRERPELVPNEIVARTKGRKISAQEIAWIALRFDCNPLSPGESPEQRLGPKGLSRLLPSLSQKTRARLLGQTKAELEETIARVGEDLFVCDLLEKIFCIDVPGAVFAAATEHAPENKFASDKELRLLFEELGIPEAKRATYLKLIAKKLDKTIVASRPEIWLEAEINKVRQVTNAFFGLPGTFPELQAYVATKLERIAVLGLLHASLEKFGSPDTFSPINADLILAEEPEGARIEALFERIEHLASWGGPEIPLDAALSSAVRDAIRAHLDGPHSGPRGDSFKHAGAFGSVATSEIARLCLTVVHDLGPNHLRRRGYEALAALESIEGTDTANALLHALEERDPRRQMLALAHSRIDEHLGRVGPETCHRDLLLALLGDDIHETINPEMMRVTMAFLDEGLAAWHAAGRGLGFYDAWRKMAEHNRFFDLNNLGSAADSLRELPPLAVDAIIQSLEKLGVPELHWGHYLRRVALSLPGLAGMVHFRETHPDYEAQRAFPIDLVQFLAVRLFYEVLFVRHASHVAFGHDGSLESFRHYFATHLPEIIVRHALFHDALPDFLAERIRSVLSAPTDGGGADEEAMLRLADMVFYYKESAEFIGEKHSARKNGFRMFLVAQHLGISPDELRQMPAEDEEKILSLLDGLSEPVIAPVWFTAYEIHYRDSILRALAENARKPYRRLPKGRPEAQLIFCIDDREEAFRRHIEELSPTYETFGAAGFFGVAIDYQALGSREAAPLCPIVATPAHRLSEQPREEAASAWVARDRILRGEATVRDVVREVLRNPVASYFLIDIIGLISLVPVVFRVLFPNGYGRMAERAREAVLPAVNTEIPLDREPDPSLTSYPPRKTFFAPKEQADRVAGLLRNLGLVKNFAPFVVLLGHGSKSRNNPHLSAYDCGACGGKHGGPNARVYARMANNPEIRAMLRERGIDIPDDTWFLGTEHNTATDIVTLFDESDVPQNKRKALAMLMANLDESSARSAHERCRKFESAPKKPSFRAAYRHVIGRTSDLAQARPELGHVTNAFAIVGPREVSEGVFLDRRSFLISYDPSIDPEGAILENILLAVGPVGAGINLEYYFSTVDNAKYGCGTKVPHNIAGLIAVMEGASGDLRTGLPKQMIEIHEAMRLVMLVVAKPEILGKIYERQAPIRELVGNAWVHLVAMDPETKEFFVFLPGKGFFAWNERGDDVPVVSSSVEWYANKLDFLDPVLIRPKESAAKNASNQSAKNKKLKTGEKASHV